ncbi:cytochrome P450 [Fennellomyces sp. T-0311]|nr:cytochrome P450 [Fennellomyces sp. T-0311]
MALLNDWSPRTITSAITVTAGALSLLYYLTESRRNANPLDAFPSPKGCYPFIGHLLSFKKLPGHLVKEWHEELGPVVRIQMGVQPWIIIREPDILHHLLTVNGAVASNRPYQIFTGKLYSHGGRGMVFQGANSRWKHIRAATALLSTSPKAVTQSIEGIQADGMRLVRKLVTETQSKGAIDPMESLQHTTVSHVLRTCFAIQVETMDKEFLQQLLEFSHQTLFFSGTHYDFGGFLPILSFVDMLPGRNMKRKRYMQGKGPLLEMLLQCALSADQDCVVKHMYDKREENGLEDIDVLVAGGDILVGAIETVSGVLKWVFALLLHHPDVQKKLINEVDDFIREHGRLPVFSDRDAFPLLNSVQRESMRFRGTNYVTLPHVLTKDIQYKGYLFPKGVLILPSAYAMHHDPERFHDPEKFIPERFLNNPKTMAAATAGKIEERDHYMFGWGRRSCPGIHLAEVEMFVFLTSVLAHCTVEPPLDGTLPDLDDVRDAGVVTAPPPYKSRFVLRSNRLLPQDF